MTRCPDCNSANISRGVGYYLPEQLEMAIRCQCLECDASFEIYEDITDPEERREVRNMAEMQREERGE